MKRDTIVFIYRTPLSRVYADIIDFKKYVDSGFNLVYLDMSRLYFPETHQCYGEGNRSYVIQEEWFTFCDSKKEVVAQIKKYAGTAWFYILHRTYTHELSEWWLFRALKKYRCKYYLGEVISLPAGVNQENTKVPSYLFSRALRLFQEKKIKQFFQGAGNWIAGFLIGGDLFLRKPTFGFAPGEVCLQKMRFLYRNVEIINAPSLNYSVFHKMGLPAKKNEDPPYLLYIDQNVHSTPDGNIFGIPTITKEVFLEKVNFFFKAIERLTGKNVIIVASPKANYSGDEFGCRKIICGNTAELVYHAHLVFVHNCSALDFAVLMKKPLIFLKIKEFSNYVMGPMKDYACSLKKEIWDIEDNLDKDNLDRLSLVDPDVYHAYQKNYISLGHFEDSIAEIIIKRLKKDNNEK